MDGVAFSLRKVSVAFGGTRALGPVSLELEANRTTVLIGPSGSGKSTLLRVLVGLIRPDAGDVQFDGRALAGTPEERRRIGFVVQGGGLFPHLTCARNVTIVARQLGWDEARIGTRLRELGALTRLPDAMLDRFPGELSGGQRQRVSIMRALMLDPEVVLLDEPLGALDPITRFELQEDLRGVFDAYGKTVVLVTHDLAEAAFFAHRVVLLREGGIVQDGPLRALFDAPADAFVTRFVNAQRRPIEARG